MTDLLTEAINQRDSLARRLDEVKAKLSTMDDERYVARAELAAMRERAEKAEGLLEHNRAGAYEWKTAHDRVAAELASMTRAKADSDAKWGSSLAELAADGHLGGCPAAAVEERDVYRTERDRIAAELTKANGRIEWLEDKVRAAEKETRAERGCREWANAAERQNWDAASAISAAQIREEIAMTKLAEVEKERDRLAAELAEAIRVMTYHGLER